MKRIFSMAIKDLRILMRDRAGAFFIIGFPILMGLFFGLVMGNMGSSGGGGGKMAISIVDQDNTEVSREFIETLKSSGSLEITLDELDAARESVRKGKRVAVMLLEEGFGETAGVFWGDPPTIKLGVDPSRAAESAMLQGFVMEAIGQLASSRFQDPAQMKGMLSQSREDLKSDPSMSTTNRMLMSAFLGSVEGMVDNIDKLQTESDDSSEAPNEGNGFQFANIETMDVSRKLDPKSTGAQIAKLKSQWDISFPQAMMWGVLGCVAGFAISIAQERSSGTLTRLRVAPISKFDIIAGKGLACFIAVTLVITAMTELGVVLGMKPQNYPFLAIAAFCISFCFVGIMMSMAVLGKTEQSVSGSGWAINMVMAMLGGCMIPVMFMPSFMKSLSVISPIKWGILSLEGAIWREFSFAEMIMPCGILLAIGSVGIAFGTWVLGKAES